MIYTINTADTLSAIYAFAPVLSRLDYDQDARLPVMRQRLRMHASGTPLRNAFCGERFNRNVGWASAIMSSGMSPAMWKRSVGRWSFGSRRKTPLS